tara:strand:- start:220 stop:1869 length:1650 start_codon:yes stop_codon:yes gene_type:complete
MSVKKTITNNYTINFKEDVIPQYGGTETSTAVTDFAVTVRRSGSDTASGDRVGFVTRMCKRKSTAGSSPSDTTTILAWSAPNWDGAKETNLGAVYLVSSSAESSVGTNGSTTNRWGDNIGQFPAMRLTTSLDTNPGNGGSGGQRTLGSMPGWGSTYWTSRHHGLTVDCNIWDSINGYYINRVIAGATRHYGAAANGSNTYIGCVHIWDMPAGVGNTDFITEYVVTASNAASSGDEFGAEVCAVSNNFGSYFFVSEVSKDVAGKNAMGQVHAYAFNKSNDPHLYLGAINSPVSESSAYWASSLAADGTTLVGGMLQKYKAGIFKQVGSAEWAHIQTLTHPSGAGASTFQYGSSVAVCGEYVAVGAPRDEETESSGYGAGMVFIYKSGSSGYALEDELYLTASGTTITKLSHFGAHVELDTKGTDKYIIVGAPQYGETGEDPGRVEIFKSGSSGWATHKIYAPHGANDYEYLGCSVDITGGVAVAGAYNDRVSGDSNSGVLAGQTYIYDATSVTTSTTTNSGHPFRFGAKTVSNIRGIGAGTNIKITTDNE